MEFHDGNSSSNNNIDMWEWPEEDYDLSKDSQLNVSHPVWDDNLWNMLGNQTPTRDWGDFSFEVCTGDNSNKVLEECEESSEHRRRRMLQFNSDANDTSMGNEQNTFTTGNSEVRENVPPIGVGLSEYFQWNPQQNSSFPEFPNIAHELETEVVHHTANPRTLGIFKGKKPFIKSPTRLTSSIAYPFSLIKPSRIQGDVTLEDINQRILAPPPSLLKLKKDENPSLTHLTSAFSGKPVVVKTKIHTEGGKGSITILRTKG